MNAIWPSSYSWILSAILAICAGNHERCILPVTADILPLDIVVSTTKSSSLFLGNYNNINDSNLIKLNHILSYRGGGNPLKVLGNIPILSTPFQRQRKRHRNHIEELQTQIQTLEQQLQTSREETRQLRNLLSLQSSKNRRGFVNSIKEGKAIEEELKQEIARLLKQVDELQTIKKELEQVLETAIERIKEWEAAYNREQDKMMQIQQDSQTKLESLKQELLQASKKQLQQMESSSLTKFQEQIQALKEESEKLLQEERIKSEKTLKSVQRALEEEQKLVLDERKKGEVAVEKERVKMRKLVKVLAEKEQKEAKENAIKKAKKLEEKKSKRKKDTNEDSSSQKSKKSVELGNSLPSSKTAKTTVTRRGIRAFHGNSK